MLTIRKADLLTDADRISELFRASFNKTRFTTDFILWKHADNPMGPSCVLVAEDEGRLVGVRSLMYWEVRVGGKAFKAIRNVDAAVHPDFQRRGIFKKMTLQGLEMVAGEYDLLFSTPNSNSLPGLLKMGWERIPQPFAVYTALRPFLAGKMTFITQRMLPLNVDSKVADFIGWRYKHESYHWAFFQDETFIIYRVEKKRGLALVILVDIFFAKQPLGKYLNSICAIENAFFFMFLKNEATATISTRTARKMRNLVVVARWKGSKVTGDFAFSLGDLEGMI